MGVMGVINVRNHTKGSWFRFVTHLVFGAALCLMTLLSIGEGQDAYNLAQTAWPLPIVAIVLFIGAPPSENHRRRILLTRDDSARSPPCELEGQGSRGNHRGAEVPLSPPMATKPPQRRVGRSLVRDGSRHTISKVLDVGRQTPTISEIVQHLASSIFLLRVGRSRIYITLKFYEGG